MATLSNIDAVALVPAGAPSSNNLTAGPDQFAANLGARYELRWINPTGASFTVKLDDPTSVTPAGALSFDPDVPLVVPNAGTRKQVVEASRFRNSSGFISWTYSAGTGAGSTLEIYGPL